MMSYALRFYVLRFPPSASRLSSQRKGALHLAYTHSVAIAQTSGHAAGETAVVEESAVGAAQVFEEIATCVRQDAGMLPRHISCRVIISKVEVREYLARETAATNIERI